MKAMLVTIGEIGFGAAFLMGAIFNLAYTMRRGAEFYGAFASNARVGPYRSLIRKVIIPNATVFTVLLVSFLGSLGLMVLTRGSLVGPALVAGAVFSLAVVPASSKGGAIANLAMAAALVLLVVGR